MDAIDIYIEYIKTKQKLTELEKDILDTWNEYRKQYIDKSSAEKQIFTNYAKNPDIFEKVNSLPTTVSKTNDQITETDLRYILFSQLTFLIEKAKKETSK